MKANNMKKIITFIVIVCVMFMSTSCLAARWLGNQYDYAANKIDEATLYKLKKEVEDTCRAMVASYTSDKLVYFQYQVSENKNEREWAEQAKMRANKTASTYNNYILKNDYVWSDNIPEDIDSCLPYLD